MAKKGFSVSGKMSVDKFEKEFEKEFGVYSDVIINGKLAPQSASLASLRPKDFKGPKTVDFSLKANMLVGNVKKKFKEAFGFDIQIYELANPDDKRTLASLRKNVISDEQESKNQDFERAGTDEPIENDELIAELKKEEETAEWDSDFIDLGIRVIDELGDKEWGRSLFKKAEKAIEESPSFSCPMQLAEEGVIEYFDDKVWVRKIYELAESHANDGEDLHALSSWVRDYLQDEEWANRLEQEAIDQGYEEEEEEEEE
jgi:hypothetical protein